MDEKKPPARSDSTLPALSAKVVPDTKLSSPAAGADDTLAPVEAAGSTAPVVVRAGGKEDYRQLTPIDPQHYVVGKEIARGGMGRILTARDRRLGRPVAIKELLVISGDLRARFEREARITAKLQHPAIVNILEAGAWPTGEPFYVMKLVTGESLDKVIADRPTLEARLGLLPNVIATVDALAYAHANRVIHRDLKPANVLVGEFGETVVIDWGLAKDLADTSSDAPDLKVGPYRGAPAGPGETVAGSVMGTPAYMPAEQAKGDTVDERADVYALGAMLYHVLAGAPPYTGSNTDMILDAVIAGPPVPLTTRAAGVPPDLVTIVNKAMAHSPADRYPTAKGLAEDLKKFQTGQLVGAHHYSSWQLLRRWVRRNRVPVAVASIAAVLLAVVGTVSLQRILREQARTKQQRLAAEQSRGEAEDLMNFMLVDLRDKLQGVGRLDLLGEVAQKAIAYYDGRGAATSDAELAQRARARRNLGDVLAAQGHADSALREYLASLSLGETLVAKDPTHADHREDLAVSHDKVGDILLSQADAPRALAEYRAALGLRALLAQQDPASETRQRSLSVSHSKVGNVLLAQGDAAGALAEYRVSLALLETLAARDSTKLDRQRGLFVIHNKIGDVLRVQGDAPGALAEYRASLALADKLATQDPANADRQHDLSVSHLKVGDALLAGGDTAAALGEYEAARVLASALAANDPTNADKQRDLSVTHLKVGDVLLAKGKAADALAAYRESLEIAKTLAAGDPTNADRQRDLGLGYIKVGNVLRAQGNAADALSQYESALAIFETLGAKDSTNADRQLNLSLSQIKVGDMRLAQGNEAGALGAYRAALAIRETLAAQDPTNSERQRDLSVSHVKVGDVLLAQGDAAGARGEYRAALALREALATQDPANVDRQRDLWLGRIKLGDVLLAQGEKSGAIVEFQRALVIANTLVAKDPTNAGRLRDVWVSQVKVGDALLAQQDSAGALAAYRAALVVAEQLAAQDSTHAARRVDLAENHEKVGDALAAQGDLAAALAEYKVGLSLAQELRTKDLKNADVQKLADSLAHKVATCCGAKRTRSPR